MLPQLSAEEIRVLGALLEKSKTTPDYYPLTLNSLITACNQKSARNPVVEYDEETVIQALDQLKRKQLSAQVIGDGRTLKYRHTISATYSLDPAETSVLCLLFLRGPLTPGEIKSNAGRLHDFEDLTKVQQLLYQLSEYETPFVRQLPKKTGQKEARFVHLFSEYDENAEQEATTGSNATHQHELIQRITVLEEQVAQLSEKLNAFINEFK